MFLDIQTGVGITILIKDNQNQKDKLGKILLYRIKDYTNTTEKLEILNNISTIKDVEQ